MDNKNISDFRIAEIYERGIPSAIMLALFSVIGVPGNLIVIMVNWKEKKMNNTNFLIFIMAFVDLLGSVTSLLNALRYTLWFERPDIKFCKLIIMMNITCNTPAIYLIFGVSVIRYCHVCKPHMVYSIHKKVKPFCICVFIITLVVTVIFAICSDRFARPIEDATWLYCEFTRENNCWLATSISLAFMILSYLFCLNGLIVLNILILQKYTQLYRRVQRYKHANIKLHTSVNKTSKHESITNTRKSLLTSINDLNESINDTINGKDNSLQDQLSDKPKSIKSGNTESSVSSAKQEEQIKSKRKNNELRMNIENDSSKTINSREGDSSTSERISVRRMSLKNNDSNKTYENDHANFHPEGINASKTNDKNLEKQFQKSCSCKGCLHKFTYFFKFEGFNKTTLKLCFVSIAYVVIYIPWFVFQVSVYFEPTEERKIIHKFNYLLFTYFPFAGCAINPVIYAFVDPKFRSQSMALFQ